ncbi:hypothetical protein OKW21_000048 [Catalinimonas alkaloidigena]|uniref:DUF6992 family protein n=1 Tax=Catalinimonas alkaloidigena TaxID=1075417 RepID=UPI002406F608|nr:hypothetical protein [Catalinimonas alkaloidigena]MDF9794785.1 hypothetical protein [Catalinimonas alkaloidigena]
MKKYILTLIFCWAFFQAFGQADNEIISFYKQQKQITKIGMLTLGGWAVGNIAVNSLLMTQASGSRYYFYQMNTFWNVVNLALAGFGYYNSLQIAPDTLQLSTTTDEFFGLQKTLLFNAGLDVAYMAGGLYLLEKAKSIERNSKRFTGYGQALILQGAFLLVFDTVLYFVLDARSSELLPLLSSSVNGIGLSLRF